MKPFTPYHRQAMSEEQLAALLAKLKDDAELLEKLKGAAGLDSAIALAKEAGFDVSEADWLKYEASKAELSDEELKDVAGGCAGKQYVNIIQNIIKINYSNMIEISNCESNIVESNNISKSNNIK